MQIPMQVAPGYAVSTLTGRSTGIEGKKGLQG